MPSLADAMKAVNAQIFEAIGEVMLVGSTEVQGIFNKKPREIQVDNGALVGLGLTFDCQYSDTVASLMEGDEVKIKMNNVDTPETYFFMRRIPADGDETGRVIIELGTPNE